MNTNAAGRCPGRWAWQNHSDTGSSTALCVLHCCTPNRARSDLLASRTIGHAELKLEIAVILDRNLHFGDREGINV